MQNTDTIIPPPASATSANDGSHSILVRLNLPSIPGMLPPANRLGVTLLARLFEARLRLAGVTVKQPCYTGDLNRAIFLLHVVGLATALKTIKETLNDACILMGAQIGWFDPREDILRIVYPATTEVLFPHAEIDAAATMAALFNQLGGDAGDQPQ